MIDDDPILQWEMGLKFNGTLIPDVAELEMQIADIDESAERDGTAELHRDRIGQKINYTVKWSALTWDAMALILNQVNSESFTAVMPDPYHPRTNRSGKYYVSDRIQTACYFFPDRPEVMRCDVNFTIIEF